MGKSIYSAALACLPAKLVVFMVLSITTSHALAVAPRLYQLGDGGAIAPHLRVEIGSDSNVLRRNAGSDSSTYVHLVPSVSYLVQQRNNRLNASYRGSYFLYGEDYCLQPRDIDCPNGSPQFDKASYQDHTLALNGFLEISRQLRVTLDAEKAFLHQPAGTGLSSNAGFLSSMEEPVSFDNSLARAQVSYGAPGARGELRFGVTFTDRNFDIDSNLSENSVAPSASVLYRLGSKTQLEAGISESTVSGGNSARGITRLFAGIEIDASAITSGTFRLSNVRENFDGSRGDLEYIGWDLGIIWKPRRFSTVTISGGRETARGLFNLDDPTVSTVVGQDIGITTVLDVNWQHSWKQRFSTDVAVSWQQNKSVDDQALATLGSDSEDLTTSVRLDGNYSLRRWLDVGAFVASNFRNGQGTGRDFSRSLVGISANGTF